MPLATNQQWVRTYGKLPWWRGPKHFRKLLVNSVVSSTAIEGVKIKPKVFSQGPHSFASTQLDLPGDLQAKCRAWVLANVAKEELSPLERQDDAFHLTVRYGLHDPDLREVTEAIQGLGPVEVKLGRVQQFEAEEYDVVVIELDAPDALLQLRSALGQLPHTDTHPEYHPHVTLAYVKKGAGRRHLGDASFLGDVATLDRLRYSDSKGNNSFVSLLPKQYAKKSVDPLKKGEVLEIGPEGQRGVWRNVGGTPIFIEVRQGESVPEAVKRETGGVSGDSQAPQSVDDQTISWALEAYLGDEYMDINGTLRDPKEWPPSTRSDKQIRALTAAFSSKTFAQTAPPPTQVFRGVVNEQVFAQMKGLKSGQTIGDKAFLSTSLDSSIAEEVGRISGASSKGAVVLTIDLPKGARYLIGKTEEKELIFRHGSALKITKEGKLDKQGRLHVTAKLVSPKIYAQQDDILWLPLSPPWDGEGKWQSKIRQILQQHPDWDKAQIKAALRGEAVEESPKEKSFAQPEFNRELTAYERKVDFKALDAETTKLASQGADRIKKLLAESRDKLLAVVASRHKAGTLTAKFVLELELRGLGQLVPTLREVLGTAFRLGQREASKELKKTLSEQNGQSKAYQVKLDPTGLPPEKALEFFERKAVLWGANLRQPLLGEAKAVLFDGIKQGSSLRDLMARLEQVFLPWLGDEDQMIDEKLLAPYRLETLVRTNITESLTEGRKAQWQEAADDGFVIGLAYSAVLDARTTEVCRHLDGLIVHPNSPEADRLSAPRHFNCRGTWVPVTRLEGPVQYITPAEVAKGVELSGKGFEEEQRAKSYQGDFDESEHPREEDGKFAPKGFDSDDGSGHPKDDDAIRAVGTGKERIFVNANGSPVDAETQARIDALGLPPAWTNIRVSSDPQSSLQAIGTDSKGRDQYRYSKAHTTAANAAKHLRVAALAQNGYRKMVTGVNRDLTKGVEEAVVMRLVTASAMRIGGESETAYGATTLEARHLSVEGDLVRFDFLGKSGKSWEGTINDADLAKQVSQRLVGKSGTDRVFSTRDSKVNKYLKQFGQMSAKDVRTLQGTSVAMKELKRLGEPKTVKEAKAFVKQVATKVSEHLRNTPAVAKKSYISPAVWAPIQAKFGIQVVR